MNTKHNYWKIICGIPLFKIRWYFKYYLYKLLGVTLPKLKSQQSYWEYRGQVYMNEILSSGYLDREIFFQDLLINKLKELEFTSFFEAGCGFGWNIKRVKEVFPGVRVGGIDYSSTQLKSAKTYLEGMDIQLLRSDICRMPLADNAFDIGFSLGVFMNLHPGKIMSAAGEMTRVCGKYIFHLEYDQDHTTPELKEKRAFKTNIISHNYQKIYQSLGKKVLEFKTYKDFGQDYLEHSQRITTHLDRWEGFEGAEKYTWILVEI
jgi:ubiquinone/menaquinone biosynthesis C-methylase UbiE